MPVRNTTGNSRPFTACSVISVTAGAPSRYESTSETSATSSRKRGSCSAVGSSLYSSATPRSSSTFSQRSSPSSVPGVGAPAREQPKLLLRPRADAPRRHVENARERDGVVRVLDQPQVREQILHLSPLVEAHAADDLVRHGVAEQNLLDRARLRIRAVEDREIGRRPRAILSQQPLDLTDHELGFGVLVVSLVHDD